MVSGALYLGDSYIKECEAKVTSVKDGKFIVLDRTIFYPKGGGQPCDTGKIVNGEEDYQVTFVGKFEGEISHEVDKSGLKEGNRVRCLLDWDRRFKLMRMHTAAHVLSAVMHKELGVLITGNQLKEDKTRFDFSMQDFDRDRFQKVVEKANGLLSQDNRIKIYDLKREKAMEIPGIVKLANSLPPSLKVLRIVEIPGVDIQADGGTHVRNLKEVGKIEILKLENKGKNNRRIYFSLM
ncbi:alanyl-tRNA editing protein AlaX [Candidatus Micrarchaeota archaeon]|nr:alanyl-tRNA editing protein AlaX [Candidatus Micrarchaeota archaeon]